MKTMRKILYMNLGVGLIIAVLFPFYANFFVEWKEGMIHYFATGCLIAGMLVALGSYYNVKVMLKKFNDLFLSKFNEIKKLNQDEHLDEYDLISKNFKSMAKQIESSKEELEKKVRDKTVQFTKKVNTLEKIKKLSVDSEIYAEKKRVEAEEAWKNIKKLEKENARLNKEIETLKKK